MEASHHSSSCLHPSYFLPWGSGIFIKLGQHISSLMVLPVEWTSTMRPLQDKCEPTPIEEVDSLFLSDMGASTSDLFSSFEPVPIGVASLAQVHLAVDRKTGQEVAVKVKSFLYALSTQQLMNC
jgi:aarF domain-containing kinase